MALAAIALLASCNKDDVIVSNQGEPKVEVIPMAPPAISLPIASDVVTVALGTDYVITADISNSQLDDFAMSWAVDGKFAGDTPTLSFHASAVGEYKVKIEAKNSDGSDQREFTIKVVDKLPYSLEFPTPSYFQTSTTRYTFPGRPVYLLPRIQNLNATQFAWSVDGAKQNCTAKGFFSPRNIKSVHAYGVELKANLAWQFVKDWYLDLNGSYSWTPSINEGEKMSPADQSVGKQLSYVPKHSASLTGRLSWKTWSFLYKWAFYSERFTMSSNDYTLTGHLPRYYMSNISLEKVQKFKPVDISLKLAVNNLFNEDYLSVLSRPMPGINFEFFIGITPKL